MAKKITLLALRSIALMSYATPEEVVKDLNEQEGPLVTAMVIDLIAQANGQPCNEELLAQGLKNELLLGLVKPMQQLDPSLN